MVGDEIFLQHGIAVNSYDIQQKLLIIITIVLVQLCVVIKHKISFRLSEKRKKNKHWVSPALEENILMISYQTRSSKYPEDRKREKKKNKKEGSIHLEVEKV